MENVNDKTAKPVPTDASTDTATDGWNPYDEYDCRSEADTPKQTQEYIDETRPAGVKEAIAKRQADLKTTLLLDAPEVIPKKA